MIFARVIAMMRTIDRPTRLSTGIPDFFVLSARQVQPRKVQCWQRAGRWAFLRTRDGGVCVVAATGVARHSGVGDPETD